jgi:hypothetical protein
MSEIHFIILQIININFYHYKNNYKFKNRLSKYILDYDELRAGYSAWVLDRWGRKCQQDALEVVAGGPVLGDLCGQDNDHLHGHHHDYKMQSDFDLPLLSLNYA